MTNLQRWICKSAVVGAVFCGMLAGPAQAQNAGDAGQVPNGSIPSAASTTDAKVASGPKILLTDANNRLWSFDTGSISVRYIGTASTELKDISFAPGGKLYGVTFTQFYKIDPNNARLTLIGNLGASGINALFCYSSSSCYAHSYINAKLYRINTATGRATLIGNTGIFKSGGDLVREDGALYLSSSNATKRLVKLDTTTGAVINSVAVGLVNLYGLAATGSNKLFGFANASVYRLNENTGAKSLIKNLAAIPIPGQRFRVGQIYGAAYNGYFSG